MASALGAMLSSSLLTESASHDLVGMPKVASLSIGLGLALPFLLTVVETRVRVRERSAAT
jgi:hypothetical protein